MPFEAVNGFFDPSVQFGLQFEEVGEETEEAAPANDAEKLKDKPAEQAGGENRRAQEARAGSAGARPSPPPRPSPHKPKGGAEVVRLDRFRKK